MENPYVISAELDLANADTERTIRKDRLEAFRENLDADLTAMGKQTLWVPSSTLQSGLNTAIGKTKLPVISLDDKYVSSAAQYLGISRGVNGLLQDDGYSPRRGYSSIEEQLKQVALLGKEVVLADDVVFSGEMVSWLASALETYGVKIGAVICGIAIQEGVEKLALEEIDVVASSVFPGVEDEICERDFALVSGSGRRNGKQDTNALYFDNQFGKPDMWASIPPNNTQEFCVNSIRRSIELLKPDLEMSTVGRFVGYGSTGKAVEKLQERLEATQ